MSEDVTQFRREGGALCYGAGPLRRLQLPLLAGIPGLAHAFTTRDADPEATLRQIAGGRPSLFFVRQVHGRAVRTLEDGEPPFSSGSRPEADAIITRRRDAAIAVHVADCVPALLCDPKSGLLGVVHAGWRGSLAGVLGEAIKALVTRGARTTDLRVGFGPSIGPCCFTVGADVADSFRNRDPDGASCVIDGASPRIDLIEANRRQAIRAGIPEDQIAASDLCTVCRPDLLESYRRSKGSPGRMAGLIAWRD